MPLKDFLAHFEGLGLNITMVSSGVSLLYASFSPAAKRKERLPLKWVPVLDQLRCARLTCQDERARGHGKPQAGAGPPEECHL